MILKAAALALSIVLVGCTRSNQPSSEAASHSAGPSPTAAAQSATASPAVPTSVPGLSEPRIEANPIDRPGVPESVFDKYWVYRGNWNSYGQAGQMGTTARIVLPNELVLGADAGLVASYEVIKSDEGSEDVVVGPDGVTIIVRDILTGVIVRTFQTPVAPSDGLMAGSRLFWFGSLVDGDAPKRMDRMVWGIDLGDLASSPVEIAAPRAPTDGSSPLRLSDGGRVVMRNIGGLSDPGRFTQVIDVATMSLRMTVEGEIVAAISDGRALISRDGDLVVRDLSSGNRIGPPLDTSEHLKTFAGDGEVFVQHGRADDGISGVYITSIDVGSGDSREVLFQGDGVRTTLMSPELSAPDVLVLFNDDWDYGPDGIAFVTVSMLDPATGKVQSDAFTLGKQ